MKILQIKKLHIRKLLEDGAILINILSVFYWNAEFGPLVYFIEIKSNIAHFEEVPSMPRETMAFCHCVCACTSVQN